MCSIPPYVSRARDAASCQVLAGEVAPSKSPDVLVNGDSPAYQVKYCSPYAMTLSCLFGDDKVAEIGSLFRLSIRPEDEQFAAILGSVRTVFLADLEM